MSEDGKKADAFSLEAGVPKIEGVIQPKPKYADRISKRIIVAALAVAVLMVGIFFASLEAMDHKKKGRQEAAETEKKKPQPAKVAEAVVPKELTDAPDSDGSKGRAAPASLVGSAPKAQDDLLDGGTGAPSLSGGAVINPASTPAGLPGTVPSLGTARARGQLGAGGLPAGTGDDGLGSGSPAANNAPVGPAPLTPEEQAERVAKQDRQKRLSQARVNGLSAKNYAGDDKKSGAGAPPAGLLGSLPQQGGGMVPTSLEGQNGQKVDSEQDEKMSFIKNSGKDDRNYLPYSPQPAVSKNELKRGSYLPLRLEGSVNSGQPGMVLARVTEDVYDTVTGCRLLVPAMSVLQGAYDSKVAIGQTRNLVVWNYMRFEDGSDLTLGGMQGYDSTGAAGIEADVDNHYLRLFGATFGMSLITAGVQMSVPSTPTGTTAQTPQQSIANALTQQYGQLGAQLIGKYLQVQPTLRNYAGERFMVMLPLTIVFKKVWRNRCVGGA